MAVGAIGQGNDGPRGGSLLGLLDSGLSFVVLAVVSMAMGPGYT